MINGFDVVVMVTTWIETEHLDHRADKRHTQGYRTTQKTKGSGAVGLENQEREVKVVERRKGRASPTGREPTTKLAILGRLALTRVVGGLGLGWWPLVACGLYHDSGTVAAVRCCCCWYDGDGQELMDFHARRRTKDRQTCRGDRDRAHDNTSVAYHRRRGPLAAITCGRRRRGRRPSSRRRRIAVAFGEKTDTGEAPDGC